MPDKPPPLPVAADRLAISNRLSMLFADRSSLIKKLVPQSSTPRKPGRHARRVDDDDIMLFGAPVNQGVGYVSDKAPRDTKREDKILRGKMLGKRKAGASEPRSKLEESESDDEQGRGSLGKRKRPRRAREAREVVKADEPAEAGDTGNAQGMAAEAETDTTTKTQESAPQTQGDQPKKKKKRKKGKSNGNGDGNGNGGQA